MVVKNLYSKLPINNITLSILGNFSLEKIKSSIKTDAPFLYFPIRKISNIKKVNITNNDKNISITILLAIKMEKIASSDIAKGKAREERSIFDISKAKIILSINSVLMRI